MLDIFHLAFEIHSPSVPPCFVPRGLAFGDWISGPLCPRGFSWFQPIEDYAEDQSTREGDGGAYVVGSFPTMDWLLLSIHDHAPVRQPSQPAPTATAEPFRSRSSNAPRSCYLQSASPYLDGWRKPCSHLLNNSFICRWANLNVPCMPCQDWTMHSPLKNGRFPIEVRIFTSILKIRRSGNMRFIFPSSCYLCPFWDLTFPTHQSPPLPTMWPTGQLSNIYVICLSLYPNLSLWTQVKSVGGKRESWTQITIIQCGVLTPRND